MTPTVKILCVVGGAVPVTQHLMFTADGQICGSRRARIAWQVLQPCVFGSSTEICSTVCPTHTHAHTHANCTLCEDLHRAALITNKYISVGPSVSVVLCPHIPVNCDTFYFIVSVFIAILSDFW